MTTETRTSLQCAVDHCRDRRVKNGTLCLYHKDWDRHNEDGTEIEVGTPIVCDGCGDDQKAVHMGERGGLFCDDCEAEQNCDHSSVEVPPAAMHGPGGAKFRCECGVVVGTDRKEVA